MRDQEHIWAMAACASLAGGASAKQAVENADKVRDAAKARFADPEDSDED
jgi:hypothetical protein